MILSAYRLIPRYNWDYGLSDFARALKGLVRPRNEESDVLAEIFGSKPILTTSGRASLYAILKALDLPGGAKVGVPLFCCPVVFDAIRQADLVPEFIDVELDGYNISPIDLGAKRKSLSAIVVVHMFGHPADMDAIKEVCEGLPIIEDCAQSLFSVYKGKQTGFLSDVSFFSFRSGKYISAGEGSAIFSRNAGLLEGIRDIVKGFDKPGLFEEILHSGSTYVKSSLYKRPWYGLIGRPVGVRLDKKLNLTAKSGFEVAQIRRTDLAVIEQKILTFRAHCAQQRENAHYLLRNLKRDGVVVPAEKTGCISNFYQFALRFESSMHRDFTAENLLRCGIDAAKYLDEVVDLARDQYGYQGGCPNSELCAKSVLSVPNHYTLSKEDLSRIADCLNRAETLWMGSGSNREGAWT